MAETEKKRVPDYEYVLVDLIREIEFAVNDPALEITIDTLKNSHGDEKQCTEVLIRVTKKIGPFMGENKDTRLIRIWERVINFFIYYKEVDLERYKSEANKYLGKEGSELIMTTAERLRKEGEERGLKKGKIEAAKNAFKEGVDFETVAKFADLSLEELLEIKKEVDNSDQNKNLKS